MIKKTIFFFIVVAFYSHFNLLCVFAQDIKYTDKKVYNAYFDLLKDISALSSKEQINVLDQFMKKQPHFDYTYQQILDLYRIKDDIDDAQIYFESLIEEDKYRLNAHWMLAEIFHAKGNIDKSLHAYKTALKSEHISFRLIEDFLKFCRAQDIVIYIDDLKNMGVSAKYDLILEALIKYVNENYMDTINLLKQFDFRKFRIEILYSIFGNSYQKLKEFEKAESIYYEGLKLARENGNTVYEIRFLINIASVYFYQGKVQKSFKCYNEVIPIAESINDYYSLLLILGNRGLIYKKFGKYELAKEDFKNARYYAKLVLDVESAAKNGYRYAQMLYFLRNFNGAISVYDEAERYAEQAQDTVLQFRIKIGRGDIYGYLNQNDLAAKVFSDAYNLAKEANLSDQQHTAKVHLANIMVRNKQYDNARKIFLNFIDYIKKSDPRRYEREATYWFWKLAQTYHDQHKYHDAKFYLTKAMNFAKERGQKSYYQWAVLSLAETNVKIGKIDEAMRWYQESLAHAQSEGKQSQLSEIYLGMGNAYLTAGQLDDAIHYYKQSIAIIEKLRHELIVDQFKIGYLSDEYEVYENLVHCYFQKYLKTSDTDLLDSLFYFDQMVRSRSLQELKFRNKETLDKSKFVFENYQQAIENLKNEQRKLRMHSNELDTAALKKQMIKLEAAKYSLLEQRLRLVNQNSADADPPKMDTCPLQIAMKNLHEAKTGLLLYHISNRSAFVLAVANNKVRILPLKADLSILKSSTDSLMNPFHAVEKYQLENLPFRADIAFRLYQYLIQPVEKVIDLPEELIVVSDPVLINVPFEMLLSEKPKQSVYTPTQLPDYFEKLLLKRYAFLYAPTTTILKNKSEPIAANPNCLIFSNPFEFDSEKSFALRDLTILTGWQLTPLPFAEKETNNIDKIFKKSAVYEHGQATEEKFFELAKNNQVIHLATHGFVDLTFDAFSGVVLAVENDSTNDGFLLGYEISDLDLDCDLLTLSACETGRGKVIAGEGVLGLPRLFFGAGANRVLMTLWRVDDKYTSELMPQFYRKLFKNRQSISTALADTKLELMKSSNSDFYYQHPFFWAAFCLYGEPGHVEKSPLPFNMTYLLSFVIVSLILASLYYLKRRKSN